MGLQAGMNQIHEHGIFVNDAENALFEYRIFHTDTRDLDHIIITNLKTGKTFSPIVLDREYGLREGAKIVLAQVARENYPNT